MTPTACHCCGLIQSVDADATAWCRRCSTRLRSGASALGDNAPAAALAVTALTFYPLAMLAPFLRIERLGFASESSLLGGIQALLTGGHYLVGIVILLFSVILPAVKLLTLLALSVRARWIHERHRASTYRFVEHLGRWGMLDVLLVAVLVAFVKLGDLVSFEIGPGLYLFAAFVALNLFAGMAFNPHALWSDRTVTGSQPVGDSMDTRNPQRTASLDGKVSVDTPTADVTPVPVAQSRRPGRRAWWLLPAAGVITAVAIAFAIWPEATQPIVITFENGRGLKSGDAVRFRGIDVGRIESMTLRPDSGLVDVHARLNPDARDLAKAETIWWIARPEVSLSGAEGLDTLVGSKYLTLRPAGGDHCTHFVGLEYPPLIDLDEPGGQSIVVQATSGPRLRPGAGVFHRGVRIGGVRQVDLASDASAIEYDVYIRPRFARLVTPQTRFWNTGGLTFGFGLDGLTVRVDSVEEILTGGMAIAVPESSAPVVDGYRFTLYDSPEEEWLSWRPPLRPDTADTPSVRIPELSLLQVSWTPTGWIDRWLGRETRQIHVLSDRDRHLVDQRLLAGTATSDRTLNVDGRTVEIRTLSSDEQDDIKRRFEVRDVQAPEDVILVGGGRTQSVAAAQWETGSEGFSIGSAIEAFDGMAVVGQNGDLIGTIQSRRITPIDLSTWVVLEETPATDIVER